MSKYFGKASGGISLLFSARQSLVTCSHVFQLLTVSVCDREAEILNIDLNQNQIQVHYVGGSDEEDEWVPCDGSRA